MLVEEILFQLRLTAMSQLRFPPKLAVTGMRQELGNMIALVDIAPIPTFYAVVGIFQIIRIKGTFKGLILFIVGKELMRQPHGFYSAGRRGFTDHFEYPRIQMRVMMRVNVIATHAKGKIYVELSEDFLFYFVDGRRRRDKAHRGAFVVVDSEILIEIKMKPHAKRGIFLYLGDGVGGGLALGEQTHGCDHSVSMGNDYPAVNGLPESHIVGVDYKFF